MGEKDGDGCGGSGRKEGVRNEEDMKDSEGEGDRDAGKIRPEDRLRQGTGWHGKECWDEGSKNKRDGEGGNRKMEHAGNMRGGDIARDGGSGSKSKGGSLASKPGVGGVVSSFQSASRRPAV